MPSATCRVTLEAVTRLVVRRVSETFEKKEPLGLTLVDVSKTFDIVSYAIILEKLKNYGVDGVFCQPLSPT